MDHAASLLQKFCRHGARVALYTEREGPGCMPSALVLGGTGFVGSHVVQLLLERTQYRVFCLSRSTATAVPAGAQRLLGDVESVHDLQAAIESAHADYVFNLAGLYAWWNADPTAFARVNTNGVRNLLDALKRCSRAPKLVHVSTVLAYGNPPGRGLTPEAAFDEDTPAGPHASLYASSKHGGDALAQAAFEAGEVPGCTLFLACCIGADPKLNDPRRDVMRLRELVLGQVPATNPPQPQPQHTPTLTLPLTRSPDPPYPNRILTQRPYP